MAHRLPIVNMSRRLMKNPTIVTKNQSHGSVTQCFNPEIPPIAQVFEDWCKKNDKKYDSEKEKQFRFNIWKEVYRKKGACPNGLADYTQDEWHPWCNGAMIGSDRLYNNRNGTLIVEESETPDDQWLIDALNNKDKPPQPMSDDGLADLEAIFGKDRLAEKIKSSYTSVLGGCKV